MGTCCSYPKQQVGHRTGLWVDLANSSVFFAKAKRFHEQMALAFEFAIILPGSFGID